MCQQEKNSIKGQSNKLLFLIPATNTFRDETVVSANIFIFLNNKTNVSVVVIFHVYLAFSNSTLKSRGSIVFFELLAYLSNI